MENKTVQIQALLLTSKTEKIISSLVMVGAASIIGGITYVSYKLGQRFAEKKILKDPIAKFISETYKQKDWAYYGSFFLFYS